ncbi:hypothetical protein ABI59_12350 [Acidobacteria bacterium Mor1]|nr:hypothetical protein ABI59_12350 [Acidobacteria bacterium Mor1]
MEQPVRYCPNPDCPEEQDSDSPSEYRADIERCPGCETELVEQLPWDSAADPPAAPAEAPPSDYETFVPVRSVPNQALIPLAKSILQAAGIRYYVRNERLGSMIPLPAVGVFSPFRFPEVTVEPGRADEARELLADLE